MAEIELSQNPNINSDETSVLIGASSATNPPDHAGKKSALFYILIFVVPTACIIGVTCLGMSAQNRYYNKLFYPTNCTFIGYRFDKYTTECRYGRCDYTYFGSVVVRTGFNNTAYAFYNELYPAPGDADITLALEELKYYYTIHYPIGGVIPCFDSGNNYGWQVERLRFDLLPVNSVLVAGIVFTSICAVSLLTLLVRWKR